MYKSRDYLDGFTNDLLKNESFHTYYEYLIAENKKTNLTRIVEEDEVYYKHFYDSLILLKYIPVKGKKLLDIGAGAGFPSFPLKLVEPDFELTVVDSLNKRIKFLSNLANELGVSDAVLIHGRAEELAKRQYFDIVTSRAVAKLNILAEISIPFVKIGGYFIAYKSVNYQEELQEALPAIQKLGGVVEKIETYEISKTEKRVLIFVKKVEATKSIYPRHFGKIKNNPL